MQSVRGIGLGQVNKGRHLSDIFRLHVFRMDNNEYELEISTDSFPVLQLSLALALGGWFLAGFSTHIRSGRSSSSYSFCLPPPPPPTVPPRPSLCFLLPLHTFLVLMLLFLLLIIHLNFLH